MIEAQPSLPNLDSVSAKLLRAGYEPLLIGDAGYRRRLAKLGFRQGNLALAGAAAEIACHENPITLRGLFYRLVSAGFLPSTDRRHYKKLGRIVTRLRESKPPCMKFKWISDHVRSTIKPSSWTGLEAFADTVQRAYRKDFWSGLPSYVHVFAEKDSIAGVLASVTHEFDVALSPIRGYTSLSFAHEIAALWSQIGKPIHAYYLGDFDPSGFDLERDLVDKLTRYCNREFTWNRLGVNAEDFEAFDLIRLEAKRTDMRYEKFIQEHGEACAEVDAIPATELRRRVREAIESHIPAEEWARLRKVEEAERATCKRVLSKFKKVG